jgi:hypothetical protein
MARYFHEFKLLNKDCSTNIQARACQRLSIYRGETLKSYQRGEEEGESHSTLRVQATQRTPRKKRITKRKPERYEEVEVWLLSFPKTLLSL